MGESAISSLLEYADDWHRRQLEQSRQQGLWSGGEIWQGGHPSMAGMKDALQQWGVALGTGDSPETNYDFLAALDKIRKGEGPGAGGSMLPYSRPGGPTEDYARHLYDTTKARELWDEVKHRRDALDERYRQGDPRKSARAERKFDAAAAVARLFGVDPAGSPPSVTD